MATKKTKKKTAKAAQAAGIPTTDTNVKIPAEAPIEEEGFFLDHRDPYAVGVLRCYIKAGGPELRLPCTLPFSDPFTRIAIVNYIQRAEGAGDTKRAKVAHAALAVAVQK